MKQCERCGMEFTDMVAATYHNTNFRHEYKRMDPIVKARIVADVEARLKRFLIGYSAPVVVKKPVEIVIERFKNTASAWETTPHVLPEPNWIG